MVKPNDLDVGCLHLDAQNPRLPEHLLGQPQRLILEHLYNEASLVELAQSFLDNGYFKHEPLIVWEREGSDPAEYVVFEGNRRLATLMVLFSLPVAEGLELDLTKTKEQLARLRSVPVIEVKTRAEVRPYVGFRHIGGLKKWPAESKARYVCAEVDELAGEGDDRPFRTLARRVGSNARAMRASYACLSLLRAARDEKGFDYQPLLDARRFGVWLRAYDAPKIREYIGYGSPTTHAEVIESLKSADADRLVEVLKDFMPDEDGPAIIDDSRDMTIYANVLIDPDARLILRETKSLETAALRVVDESLVVTINRLVRQIDVLGDKALRTRMDNASRAAAERLFTSAKKLRLVVQRDEEE